MVNLETWHLKIVTLNNTSKTGSCYIAGATQNNIFTQATGRAASTRSGGLTEGVVIMSTYEELQLITSVAMLIVAILTYTHKK